jgi:large subunit ribosomal protein L15
MTDNLYRMSISANTINQRDAKRKKKRVGRGNASQKGTTAGRGMKGQRARSGGRSKTALRGFRIALQKIPKNRGFVSLVSKKETVTLSTLSRVTSEGEVVTPFTLAKKGVIADASNGVKVVATGTIDKKITLSGCGASKAAIEAILGAGGAFEV